MIESHISLPKYFVENKLTDFQISGTVLFIERNQKKNRFSLFHVGSSGSGGLNHPSIVRTK